MAIAKLRLAGRVVPSVRTIRLILYRTLFSLFVAVLSQGALLVEEPESVESGMSRGSGQLAHYKDEKGIEVLEVAVVARFARSSAEGDPHVALLAESSGCGNSIRPTCLAHLVQTANARSRVWKETQLAAQLHGHIAGNDRFACVATFVGVSRCSNAATAVRKTPVKMCLTRQWSRGLAEARRRGRAKCPLFGPGCRPAI